MNERRERKEAVKEKTEVTESRSSKVGKRRGIYGRCRKEDII